MKEKQEATGEWREREEGGREKGKAEKRMKLCLAFFDAFCSPLTLFTGFSQISKRTYQIGQSNYLIGRDWTERSVGFRGFENLGLNLVDILRSVHHTCSVGR